jgi:hypothetical protein
MVLVKLVVYQLLRAVNHVHCRSLCHRAVQPRHVLVNPGTSVVQLCGFGRWAGACAEVAELGLGA